MIVRIILSALPAHSAYHAPPTHHITTTSRHQIPSNLVLLTVFCFSTNMWGPQPEGYLVISVTTLPAILSGKAIQIACITWVFLYDTHIMVSDRILCTTCIHAMYLVPDTCIPPDTLHPPTPHLYLFSMYFKAGGIWAPKTVICLHEIQAKIQHPDIPNAPNSGDFEYRMYACVLILQVPADDTRIAYIHSRYMVPIHPVQLCCMNTVQDMYA